jgi:hypothetical protein
MFVEIMERDRQSTRQAFGIFSQAARGADLRGVDPSADAAFGRNELVLMRLSWRLPSRENPPSPAGLIWKSEP